MAAGVTSCPGRGAGGSPAECPRPSCPVRHPGGSFSWPAEVRSTAFCHTPESPDEATVADQESEDDLSASRTSLERQAPPRGNTTVHVCWHRNTSVSMVDFSVAVEVWTTSWCSPGPRSRDRPPPGAGHWCSGWWGRGTQRGRTTEPCWLQLPRPRCRAAMWQRRWVTFFTPENLSSEMGLAQDMSRETLSQGRQGPASGVGYSP